MKNEEKQGQDSGETAKKIADSYNRKAIESLSEAEAKDMCYRLLNDLIEIEKKVKILERINRHLKVSKENKKYDSYNPSWPLIEKIMFVLTSHKKVLTASELTRELLLCEPILKQKWANPSKSVSEALSSGLKLSRIIRCQKIGLRGFTYALPEWFDPDHQLKPGFKR